MAAPKGNKFWMLRAKHGRDTIISSPDALWESAVEYFDWCEANPLKEHDFVGKDAIEVDKNKMRAMTMTGLYLFLDIDNEVFTDLEKKKDFSAVATRIRNVIYTQKFTGAAAGLLNPSIIARDLGLKEKTENEQILRLGKENNPEQYKDEYD